MGSLRGVPYETYKQHDEWGSAPELLAPEDRARIESGDWSRTANGQTCDACGLDFEDHKVVVGALWLTRLCDGRLVKL